jgi:biotin synthase
MSCYRPEAAVTEAAAGEPAVADAAATATALPDATHPLDHNPWALMQPRAPARPPKEARNGARVIANHVPPQGVYLPNNNVLTPFMRSPEYVQMSTAAAITLGIMPGKMYRCGCTRCLNLLLTYPEGCRANCAYCGLARHREAERDYADRNFIRVDWPAVPLAQAIDIVAKDGTKTPFHRMCISMITHPRSDADAVSVLKAWTDRVDPSTVPVSILSNPTTMERDDVVRLRELGADIFTVALDAATPELFERTRGRGVQSPHSWAKYWEILHHARDVFGAQHFGAHIIVGMGETEHDVLSLVQRLVDLGGHSHMFCFFPEQGSLMDHLPATPRDQWRRVQLGRYLIDYGGVRVDNMRFDGDGRVTDFGIPAGELDDVIDRGVAFRTSGCPGKFADDVSACDRPYGDSPPSDIASYPFAPNRSDIRTIRKQLRIVPEHRAPVTRAPQHRVPVTPAPQHGAPVTTPDGAS